MTFQISALDPAQFAPLFDLDDDALARMGARREIVTEHPGSPCRVSLADAPVGEEVLLLNYAHLQEVSPYRAAHAIYVRRNATQAKPAPGEVPDGIASRLVSVRGFGADHYMKVADVVSGASVADRLHQMFADPAIAYVHIHNAKQGCFAACVTRSFAE